MTGCGTWRAVRIVRCSDDVHSRAGTMLPSASDANRQDRMAGGTGAGATNSVGPGAEAGTRRL
eukprot:5801999-Prymnesium_polylepis.1